VADPCKLGDSVSTLENLGKNSGPILISSIKKMENSRRDGTPLDVEIDIMQARWKLLGEGASQPDYPFGKMQAPALVIVPIPGSRMTPETAEEIYRVALEWARAAFRPSLVDLARGFCLN
jgi:hypothetical protein